MAQILSRFPALWPRPGYLLLRIALAAAAVFALVDADGSLASTAHHFQNYLAIGLAAMLVLGLLTPIAALLLAGALLNGGCEETGACIYCYLLGVISLGLALVGPGGWSLDDHFFGRKKIEVPLPDRE